MTLLRLLLLFAMATTSSCAENVTHLVPSDGQMPPSCDGCVCVTPDDGECPSSTTTATLPTRFEPEHISRLKALQWENAIVLDCDPYLDNCTMTDSVEGSSIEGVQDNDIAVCGMRYNNVTLNKTSGCSTSYETKTFSSREELDAAEGYFLTHYGACGTCSSTQDLAVYMELQYEPLGFECGALAISNETAAQECFEGIGFTKGCAATWLYNTIHTRENCLSTCLDFIGKPPNLDAPQCPFNACLECDEVFSGPIFRTTAGRSRRRSGVLSYIAHNCSQLFFDVMPTDPCPTTTTSSSTAVSWLVHRGTIVSALGAFLSFLVSYYP
ncbi:expressed unknown protein [Seminavis robusta]|uniref:Uncharacterized protein n=1 Tax=Seminavis robusta TaxID=568900 RepID=A0A9N8HLG0_9STRA|nr:expressed unknown protein [Seminavis robusta]|eukprot:Sro913_g219450.1 n/a (326) ;mRNA; f:23166-24225